MGTIGGLLYSEYEIFRFGNHNQSHIDTRTYYKPLYYRPQVLPKFSCYMFSVAQNDDEIEIILFVMN